MRIRLPAAMLVLLLSPAAATADGPRPAVEPAQLAEAAPPAPGDAATLPQVGAPQAEDPAAVPPAQRRRVLVGTIVFLVSLVGLAYLFSAERVRAIETRLGVSELVAAGLPFLLLGLAARSTGVIDPPLLRDLSPILRLGLGWIGFVIGTRFDPGFVRDLPRGTARRLLVSTMVPFLAVVIASSAVLLLGQRLGASTFAEATFLRDALLLASAGTLAARRPGDRDPSGTNAWLEQIPGVLGLLVVGAYFRPAGVAWALPGTAWLFVTLGIAVVLGLLAIGIFARDTGGPEALVLLLGTVAFASGFAAYLLLSPVAVCFLAGLILVNSPGTLVARTRDTLLRLERPIYLLFLVVAGAVWDVADPRGWLLMLVFLAARSGGRALGSRLGGLRPSADGPARNSRAALDPMGPLAIAVVVNAQALYPDGAVPVIVTAVIGGSFLTEALARLPSLRRSAA